MSKCLLATKWISSLGTHPELSRKMKEIEEKREQRLRIAKAWRTHMGEIAQCEFEIKEYQAHCTYQSKKRELRNDIATETGRKMRKVQLDLDFSSESRRRKLYADKVSLLRSRKQRRAEVYELWAINEHIGFPCSTKLRAISSTELDEDFDSMGLPRPSLEQPSTSDYAPQYQHPHHQHQQDQQYPNRSSQSSMSSPRPNTGAPITAVDYGGHAAQATAAQRWNASTDYTPTLHHNNEHFGIYRKPMRT
ncbi:hypothetical protein BCR41DRAFT_118183 [Lobosporangium transversale]|uniref:Sds3-like-domain-containing protein n=1 Tax=Lobosporangium transversale TaxID=64571 RepID=A0A1Y2GZF3_9FUNG|nr:hypothetical protein BCR41DRAFT_118183 [Lobosporangium transversale]ORZ27679.1 hypothetical protein BCR41DRAFT_118183 [Lobosporangium transversale]|eukprot:XP_021885382.1 hypothetical protein BCR41DRAFT_118183 [Lobosporangium transversale]